jgi:amidohydrolase
MSDNLKQQIRELLPSLIDLRHDLHAHPEIGFDLPRTAGLVASRLRGMGLEPREGIGKSGVTALIESPNHGPAVALRADMDALPVTEETGAAYASTTEGAMHACGHDGHTTVLLGAATLLAREPNQLPGTVKLIFQPAEETAQGARAMIEDGVLENPRPGAIFALHSWPGIAIGKIGLRAGPLLASADLFDAVVTGKGGHAAQPDGAIDPIVVASHVVTAWQTYVSRHTPATEPVVVSVTRFDAGTAYNVIPSQAKIAGTYRTVSETTRAGTPKVLRRIAEGVCSAFGASFELTVHEGTVVTVNDPRLTEHVAAVAHEALGEGSVEWLPMPTMASEDFGYLSAQVPGVFFCLGQGDRPLWHNPKADFADESIATGVEMMVRLARSRVPGAPPPT